MFFPWIVDHRKGNIPLKRICKLISICVDRFLKIGKNINALPVISKRHKNILNVITLSESYIFEYR